MPVKPQVRLCTLHTVWLISFDFYFFSVVYHQNQWSEIVLQISEKSTAELDSCLIRTLKLPRFEMLYVNPLSRTMNFVLNCYTSTSLIFKVQIVSSSLSLSATLVKFFKKKHPSLASICRPNIAKCLNINKCT